MAKMSKRDIERMNTAAHLDKLSSRELQKKIDRWQKEDRLRDLAYGNYNNAEKARKDRLQRATRAGLALANEIDYSKFLTSRINRAGFPAGPEGDAAYNNAVEGMEVAGKIAKNIVKTGVGMYNAYNTSGPINTGNKKDKKKDDNIKQGGINALDKDEVYIPGLHNPEFSLMHSEEFGHLDEDVLQHAKWSEFKKNLVSQARKAGKSVYEMFPQYYSSTAKYVQNAKANFRGYARKTNQVAKNAAARVVYGNNSMKNRASWQNIGNRVRSNTKRAAINVAYSKGAGIRKASRDEQYDVTAKDIARTATNRGKAAAKRVGKKVAASVSNAHKNANKFTSNVSKQTGKQAKAALKALQKGGPQAAAAARDMLKKGAKYTSNAYKDAKKATSRAVRDDGKVAKRALADGKTAAKKIKREVTKKTKRAVRDAKQWLEYSDKNIQRLKEDIGQNVGYNLEKAYATVVNGGSLSKKQQKELEKKYGKDWWSQLKKDGSRAIEDIQDGSMAKKAGNKVSDTAQDAWDKGKDSAGNFFNQVGRKLSDAHQAGKDSVQDYMDYVSGNTNKDIAKEKKKTAEKAKKNGTVVESSYQTSSSPGNSAGINPVTGLPYSHNPTGKKKKNLKQSDVFIPGQLGLAQDILMHGYSSK